MKKTTLLMAVIAAATVIAAGLVVIPGSVQEVQANPCSGIGGRLAAGDSDTECLFAGDIEITPTPSDMGGGSGATAADIPLLNLADLFDESD
jgi:hypothetical protein